MIPIYRAKKIDSDEYVEGWYSDEPDMGTHYIRFYALNYEIDPSTLAIHFPDMIDSEGTKIFVSLSEDGKGGDIVEYAGQRIGTCLYCNGELKVGKLPLRTILELSKETKVTGIQD